MVWSHAVGAGCLLLFCTLLAPVWSLDPREAHADSHYAGAARLAAEVDVVKDVIVTATDFAFEAPNDIELDLEPGRYALICFVPDATDGRPHFLHGMATDIEID